MANSFLPYSDHFVDNNDWKVPALGKEYGPGEDVPAPVKARRGGPEANSDKAFLNCVFSERAHFRDLSTAPCFRCADPGQAQSRRRCAKSRPGAAPVVQDVDDALVRLGRMPGPPRGIAPGERRGRRTSGFGAEPRPDTVRASSMPPCAITDEVARSVPVGGGSAARRADALLAIMSEQAAAVAMVRAKWIESVRAVPPEPGNEEPNGLGVAPLADARRDRWFRAEGVREMWFSRYVGSVGWWVDTAQLALESAAGEPDAELWRVAATSPYRTWHGSIAPARLVQQARIRCWGENWINDSLPRLLGRDDLERLLALTGDANSARPVRLAHRSVLDARNAGDLALEQEESGSGALRDVNRNWNLYGRRHHLVCEYAHAIADHLRKRAAVRR